MSRRARLVLIFSSVAMMMFAVSACKGGSETEPTNPKPPAEQSPTPTAPAPQAEPAPEAPEAGEGEAAEAPAGEAAPTHTPVPVSAEAQKEADNVYTTLCSTCHGMNGSGDGPAAAAFNPKPANYASAEFQKSVTDEEIAKAIVEGGPAVGKSPLMPPNPQLKDKPEVVQALVNKVRAFGAQAK